MAAVLAQHVKIALGAAMADFGRAADRPARIA
jgi:hypothetical protein